MPGANEDLITRSLEAAVAWDARETAELADLEDFLPKSLRLWVLCTWMKWRIWRIFSVASVWRHPQSRYWVACFRDASGRRRKISTKVTSRSAALKIAHEYEKASRLKQTRAQTRLTIERLHAELSGESYCRVSLREHTAQWLASKIPEIAPSTQKFYRESTAKLISALGSVADQPMADIGKADLLRFRNNLAASGLAPKTVNHILKCCRMLFKAAKMDGIISENPAEFVSTVRNRPRENARETFSLEQLRAVLAVADREWRSLVLFGFYTGQRLGDLAQLRWSNIDLESGRITMLTAKTNKRLILPLAPPLTKHIESLPCSPNPLSPLHPRAWEIVDSQGRTGALSRQFGELLARAGLRAYSPHNVSLGVTRSGPRNRYGLSFHSLRRTATTLLHEAGISQAVAQTYVGHDSEGVHQVYISVGDEALSKAAAAFPDLLSP
jgi:integrase